MQKIKFIIHKITHWEYWEYQILYFPLIPVWFYLCIKARSFGFFNAANPKIKNGGFLMESKKSIYDMLPKNSYPKTLFFQPKTTIETLKYELSKQQLVFPLIAKPDIGLKGLGVKKIENIQELHHYSSLIPIDFLVQEFINFEKEVGVFYVKFSNEKKGFISGIVQKEFMTVFGNGTKTILELIEENPRYQFQIKALKHNYGDTLNQILKNGEIFNLVPYGNHARGAKFTNGSHLITIKLTETINTFFNKIPEFYFGRLDIKYNNWNDLENGNNFSIIELNAAGSEPTHIYDPDQSVFFAWKELIRHFRYLNKISIENHKKGHPYLSFSKTWKMYTENNKIMKLLTKFQEK